VYLKDGENGHAQAALRRIPTLLIWSVPCSKALPRCPASSCSFVREAVTNASGNKVLGVPTAGYTGKCA